MSIAESPTPHPSPTPEGPMVEGPTRPSWPLWTWAAIGCALLASSGVVRAVQDRRHRDEASYVESCPFPLKEIPTTLGGWRLLPGQDKSLDPLTMRITGGTDHILRTYVDELTGVSLVVLVLFGPAEPVLPHTPEACYPASGYTATDDSGDRAVACEGGKSVPFRSAVYQKSGGRSLLREEVYHSFRLDGNWSPYIGNGRKFPRRNPGVFKIQIQRRVAEGERRDRDDPIEQFLALLIPEIERKIDEAGRMGKGKAAEVAPDAASPPVVDARPSAGGA